MGSVGEFQRKEKKYYRNLWFTVKEILMRARQLTVSPSVEMIRLQTGFDICDSNATRLEADNLQYLIPANFSGANFFI